MKNCILAIFGATGDLAKRKLFPALFALEKRRLFPAGFRIFGLGRTPLSREDFRRSAASAISSAAPKALERFLGRLDYFRLDYQNRAGYDRFFSDSVPCGSGRLLFHLAVPPETAEDIVRSMAKCRAFRDEPFRNRAVFLMEKPFGMDLSGARRLNRLLQKLCPEENIYRIDHFLAKDTVRNILVFRFGNAIFEPLWNRNYIESVRIVADEALGVENRGHYYDRTGVVRDMIQNHVLQLLALTAMEAPDGMDAESVRQRKHEVFHQLRPLQPENWRLGQYTSYRLSPGVAPDSRTPTFAALDAFVDNWRWSGVPFHLESGKCLPQKYSGITVVFRPVPLCVLSGAKGCAALRKNSLTFTLQPGEGIHLEFNVRPSGLADDAVSSALLDYRYPRPPSNPCDESYAKVVYDALRGKPALFWRSDSLEEAWKFVAPMLSGPDFNRAVANFPNYGASRPAPSAASHAAEQRMLAHPFLRKE